MIVLENVRKSYQMGETVVTALKGVTLRIEDGEFVSLIGASGSGKSTLLHTIGLLDRPDSGLVSIAGRDVSKIDDEELSQLRSEAIGFVFQQFHLLKRLTAFENVELPLIYAKGSRPSSDPGDLLGRVGLGERSHHRPNELSGGQQQRVAIARALIRRPSLILADEPTGNLDSQSGKEIMALLRELHAEGLTVVLVTHEPSIAATADRTIRVHDGEIVEDIRKPDAKTSRPSEDSLRAKERAASARFERDLLLLNLRQAGRGLWANKLRTCLSALGIIIGVSAVIVMLALGAGAQDSMKKQIAALGSNRLMVQPQPQHTAGVKQQSGAVSRLTVDEAMNIDGRIPTVTGVSGMVQGRVQVVYGDKNANTQLQGTMPGYEVVYNAYPAYGRFYTLEECVERARVAVLGTTVVGELFGTANPVGKTVQINHVPFRVIGVLTSKGASGGGDADDIVLVPLQTAMKRVLGKKFVDWIDVSAASPMVIDRAQSDLLDLTREWPHIPNVEGDSYQIRNFQSVIDAFSNITKTMAILLGVGCRHLAGRRRHRDHEHHACLGDGADARDRPAQGAGRARPRHPDAVPHGSGRALPQRRPARHRHRFRPDAGRLGRDELGPAADADVDGALVRFFRGGGRRLWLLAGGAGLATRSDRGAAVRVILGRSFHSYLQKLL